MTVQSAGKTLLTWAALEAAYLGSFAVPNATVSPDQFAYSPAIHAQLPGGNLYMVGHDQYQRVREVVPPSVLDGREAAAIGNWFEIVNKAGFTEPKIGGLLFDDVLTRTTIYTYYNSGGYDQSSQGTYDGTIFGPWQTSVHDHYCNGYLSPSPLPQFDYLAGNVNTPGDAINRYGPNLFGIVSNPGGTHPATALIHHPDTHAFPGWWLGDRISSMLWIDTPTRHGILAFGYRGLTGKGYKCDNGIDPYLECGGFSATSYDSFLWIYDPDDVAEVLAGIREPWSLVPVEEKILTYGNGVESYYTMFRGKPVSRYVASISNGRLIVAVSDAYQASQYSRTPICYVFGMGL